MKVCERKLSYEENISAEQTPQSKDSRFQSANGNKGREKSPFKQTCKGAMASDSTVKKTLTKENRLRKRREFLYVYGERKPHFFRKAVIYVSKNEANVCRLGLTIPKKIGNAVLRNRIKRILREAFRNSRHLFNENYDFVINARKDSSELTLKEAMEMFEKLSRRF